MSFGKELTVCMTDEKIVNVVEVHVDMRICLC